MQQNGILTIDNVEHKTDIKDLEDLGELGSGTSGHVEKMKHKPTNKIIAVKVSVERHQIPNGTYRARHSIIYWIVTESVDSNQEP